MDFRRLSRAISSPPHSGNASQPLNLTDLSPNILDALIPGYSILSQYALAAFGVDISSFVIAALLLLAITKGGAYLATQLERTFRYLFMSSVHIDDGDDLFEMVMTWLDAREPSRQHRSVRAKTPRGSQWEDANDCAANEAMDEKTGLFDYNKWSASTPPRYEPHYGKHVILHNGRLFVFQRTQRSAHGPMRLMISDRVEEDVLQIDCIGRSPQPTKDLLRAIKSWSPDKRRNTTTIRHPQPKDQGRFRGVWAKTSSRPSRPMDTVILDNAQKARITRDMNGYLHPLSPRWYATRGIPYRRGYLFHGPPGTGKTSLSFALAGIFGLEIYAISLQEPTLTEGDLMQLFNHLPKRCIVLLEDVDAAGLLRDGKSDTKGDKAGKKTKAKGDKSKDSKDAKTKSEKEKEKGKKEEDYTLKDLARELKAINAPKGRRSAVSNDNNPANGHPNRLPGAGISLSGLLNAIDGVATHEGRVLIMTTNQPEKLDSALVRPGRIDLKIEFGLAMKEQIRELFVRMYAASEVSPLAATASLANGNILQSISANKFLNGAVNGSANGFANGHRSHSRHDSKFDSEASDDEQLASMTPDDLDDLAAEFAQRVPDATYSPAEIQNHLMKYKNFPRTAVDTVAQWMEGVRVERERLDRKVDDNDDDDDNNDEDGDKEDGED